MITEAIFSFLFAIGSFLVGLLPDMAFDVIEGTTSIGTVLAYALVFFPLDIWLFGIGAIITMMATTLIYALLEWVWKKVPGVE